MIRFQLYSVSRKALALTLALTIALTAVLLTGIVPAAAGPDAQDSTFTLTEDQINRAYQAGSTARWRVESKSVDLQPGQAVLSAVITPRGGNTYTATVVFVPRLDGSSVVWDTTSVTVNGTAATEEQLATINSALVNSFRRYLKTTVNRYLVSGVQVTDDAIIYTYAVNPDRVTVENAPSGRFIPSRVTTAR